MQNSSRIPFGCKKCAFLHDTRLWFHDYNLILITKSISMIFIPNFVCVLTNERYKTYQAGFSFCCPGHAPGMGFWGARGAQRVKKSSISDWIFILSPGSCLGVKNQNPSYCLSVMLSPKPFNEIHKQIWCVSYSHGWGVHGIFCLAPRGPGEGSKGQLSFNFIY